MTASPTAVNRTLAENGIIHGLTPLVQYFRLDVRELPYASLCIFPHALTYAS